MKKRILCLLLALLLILASLPMTAFAAVLGLGEVTFTVCHNQAAGLGGDVLVTFTKSGNNYRGTLYLPGSADTEKLALSFDGDVTVSTADGPCISGETPVPAKGETRTYTVALNGAYADFTVTTMQGSAGVEGLFLNIDESLGTIAAMNNDPNHETECFGAFTFKGKDYFLKMKGRGNWTWTNCVKKPYNFTVYKDNTYSAKDGVKLMTDVKAKKWSILANELDSSYLRNKIGYDIAYELGVGLPSESIDVWMNGEYLGNYLLTPKNDYKAPDDGYMVEIDNKNDVDQFTLPGSPLFTVKNMADDLTVNDVKASVSKAWDALRQSDSDDYLNYFDLDSWAKVYLLQELYKNLDAGVGSLFFTKASMVDGDKLVAGPVWDLDQTFGRTNTSYVNLDRNNENSGGGWYIDSISDYQSPFYQLLGKHKSFMQRVYEIYNENKAALENILANVDTQSALIADSAHMDFSYWSRALAGSASVSQDNQTFGTGKYAVTYQKTDTWEAYIGNMKEYITKRLAFLSDNLYVDAPEKGTILGATGLTADDTMTLTADTTAQAYQWQSSNDGVAWTDIAGATAKTYSVKATASMNGLMVRCVAKNTGNVINTTRVAKVAPAAATTLDAVTLSVSKNGFYVAKNTDAGLGGDVDIAFTNSGNHYSGTLYLPGSADTEKLTLSWNSDAVVSVGEVTYESGKAPLPANGESLTYTVTLGGTTANYTVTTIQGSAGVEGLFLNIDESLGTIAAMLDDPDHETECFGDLSLDGASYDMSIKGRGNSSWTFDFDKKPFNITLYKDEDASKNIPPYTEKKKAELIDGVGAKKWTLLANAKDSSLLRNKIGYDLASAMGLGVENRFVDVWMNGEYLGNYLLTPKTDTLAPKNGYQIELERRTENEDPQFTLKGFENGTRPIYFTVKDNGADAQVSAIKAYMQQVADAILDTKSSDYLNYIDLDSWAKMYLLNELYKDVDVVTDSIFMYRNGTSDSDKLYAGPVWDLDGAIGRTYSNGYCGVDNTNQISPDQWYIDGIQYDNDRGYLSWFQMLGRHQDFMQRVYEIYNEYSDVFDALETQIPEQAALIADSAAMNFTIHPVNQTVERMFNVETVKSVGSGNYRITYRVTNSWSDYVDNLKTFIAMRNRFLSDNLSVAIPPAGTISGETAVSLGDEITLTADTTAQAYQWQSSNDGVAWTDIAGATAKTYTATATMVFNGLSLRCVAINTGDVINTTRVAKATAQAVTVLPAVTLTVSLEGHEHNYQVVVTDPTCTQPGHTTHTCLCGDSYTDHYTDPTGHRFVYGECTVCHAKDPTYVPECIGRQTVSLKEGALFLLLNGVEAGPFTFARSNNGWSICSSAGTYLSVANRSLTYAATPFTWTYANGRFSAAVSSGWGFPWGDSTTTYYLTFTGGILSVSTSTNGATATFEQTVENPIHTFGDWIEHDGQHGHICSVCGALRDLTDHTDEDGNGVCDTCKTVLFLFGDVNGDLLIDTLDLAALKNHLAGLSDTEDCAAGTDVDRNGTLDVNDLVDLKRYLAGLIDTLG